MNNLPLSTLLPALCALGISGAVDAGHGAVEINQARALPGGATPLDAPGFPVTLSEPGEYILTGNLDLSAESSDSHAIEVTAARVRIDLRGFQIVGPVTCTGNAAAVICDRGGNGVGIYSSGALVWSSPTERYADSPGRASMPGASVISTA